MSAPVAVASIQLSEEERKRIAAELGLGEDQLDSIPTSLGIAKYEVEESDVEGFAFNPGALTFQASGHGISPSLRIGKTAANNFIPPYLLVAV